MKIDLKYLLLDYAKRWEKNTIITLNFELWAALKNTELENAGKAFRLSSGQLLIQDSQVYDSGVQRGDFHSRDMNISGIDWAHIAVKKNGEKR